MVTHRGRSRFGRTGGASCVLAMLLVAFSMSFCALGQRATDEQMDRATKTLDEYCKDIRANYQAVDALILKRGKSDTGEVVGRLEKERLASGNPLDKAIYGYLLARAYYWQGYHQFKATRNPDVFNPLRSQVVAEFLAAFEDINQAEPAMDRSKQVRADIIGAFASALATNLWGAALSPEEKQQAATRFVDIVEKMPEHKKLLPTGSTLAHLYRNLGIGNRLDDMMVPKELPRTYNGLMALLTEARGVVSWQELSRIAAALERDHLETLKRTPMHMQLLADAYADNGSFGKARQLLQFLADRNSQYCLDLYVLSLNDKADIPMEESQAYCDRFIAGGSPAADAQAPAYSRGDAYARVTRALINAKRYKQGLEIVARYNKDESFERGTLEPANILLLKARCLDGSGDKEAAVAAYETFLEESYRFGDVFSRNRERAEQRIQKLTAP